MPSWVQDKQTGKLIPKEEWLAQQQDSRQPYIQGNFEPFKSPIDGRLISDRAQLRAHNAEHGVTDMRDYSESYFRSAAEKRRAETFGQTKAQQQQRREEVAHMIDKLNHR